MKTQKTIKLHRFNDLVAFDTGDTPTLYLSPDMAHRFADQLQKFVHDILLHRFDSSVLDPVRLIEKEK